MAWPPGATTPIAPASPTCSVPPRPRYSTLDQRLAENLAEEAKYEHQASQSAREEQSAVPAAGVDAAMRAASDLGAVTTTATKDNFSGGWWVSEWRKGERSGKTLRSGSGKATGPVKYRGSVCRAPKGIRFRVPRPNSTTGLTPEGKRRSRAAHNAGIYRPSP